MSMRRSKAFVLSEVLMTILLQAGFILVLCMSFYLFLDFYTRTQQILTARNHAERVIQFMDDKIRNAGLGLWRCDKPEKISAELDGISKLKIDGTKGYRLPIALTWYKDGRKNIPQITAPQNKGDVLSLLYTQRDGTSGGNELVLFTNSTKTINGSGSVGLIDSNTALRLKYKEKSSTVTSLFDLNNNTSNINNYAVAESVGIPFFLKSISGTTLTLTTKSEVTIPAATELMYLKFVQVFVHDVKDDDNDDLDRQFAFSELKYDSLDGWGDEYNQEKGILEIYMTLDTDTNIFTLYVLASGGEDESANNPRPEAWPDNANWDGDKYPHHVVYVARKSWKLNNIPENFKWN